MAYFKDALNNVFSIEGGFSNTKSDRGGATNFGISTKLLKAINYPKTAKQLTRVDAIEIYQDYFWKLAPFDQIKNQRVANKIFEFVVNAGFENAIPIVQRTVNSLTSNKIQVDGVFGTITLIAINMLTDSDESQLMNGIKAGQADYYKLIALRDPTQEINLEGWLNRAAHG